MVVFVVIDEAENVDTVNSGLATELASAILKDVLPFLEIYPTRELIQEEETSQETSTDETEVVEEETEAVEEETEAVEEETEVETEEDVFSPDAIPDSMDEEETDSLENE